MAITDDDGNGLPDTSEQVEAIFSYAVENGVPADDSTFVYSAGDIGPSQYAIKRQPCGFLRNTLMTRASPPVAFIGPRIFMS